MAAADENNQPELFLNFFNIPQPKIIYLTNPISPSPSAQSENSLESGNPQIQNDPESSEEDSTQELTNLTWLTQLKNLVAWPNSINPILDDESDSRNRSSILTSVHQKKDTLNDRFQRFLGQARQNRETYDKSADLYQRDTTDKPPFNYAQMIAMAMLENGRMTLQHICTWIQNKFGYYRVRNNWNNSIRHNLSLQFCFRKIDRNVYNKGDGKGGYWELGIDANKSERKRIRNRKTVRSGGSGGSENCQNLKSPTAIEQKRRKFAAQIDDDGEMMIDNDVEMFQRTLNSLNTNIAGGDSTTLVGIGSIIEVDQQQQHLINMDGGNGCGQSTIDNVSSSSSISQQIATHHEYYVMGDITNSDYLNIGTLDLVSSGNDIFENGEFSTATSTPGVITMLDPVTMEANCENEIFLASEVPQPSENVVISALDSHQYGDSDGGVGCGETGEFHEQNSAANAGQVIIDDAAYALPMDDNNLKSYFDGIDQEFQLLRNSDNRGGDELIDALYDMSTGQDF